METHPNSTQTSKCQPECMHSKQIYVLVMEPHIINLTYFKVSRTDRHGYVMLNNHMSSNNYEESSYNLHSSLLIILSVLRNSNPRRKGLV